MAKLVATISFMMQLQASVSLHVEYTNNKTCFQRKAAWAESGTNFHKTEMPRPTCRNLLQLAKKYLIIPLCNNQQTWRSSRRLLWLRSIKSNGQEVIALTRSTTPRWTGTTFAMKGLLYVRCIAAAYGSLQEELLGVSSVHFICAFCVSKRRLSKTSG